MEELSTDIAMADTPLLQRPLLNDADAEQLP
jgi:hypothetical protein